MVGAVADGTAASMTTAREDSRQPTRALAVPVADRARPP